MRVVAGSLRGRRIEAPKGESTRPTTDRVREAIFSSLEARRGGLTGARVLDPFAGSGALAIEALSRGAAHATLVDRDRTALAVLKRNLDSLALTKVATVIPGDSFALATRPLGGAPFDLLLLDPPYKTDPAEIAGLVDSLSEKRLLSANALVMWEHSTTTTPVWPDGYAEVWCKKYGDTTVTIAVGEGEER